VTRITPNQLQELHKDSLPQAIGLTVGRLEGIPRTVNFQLEQFSKVPPDSSMTLAHIRTIQACHV